MRVLHTESSNGWGGQEIRILKESIGLRDRGHTIVFAITRGGKLAQRAREKGFKVFELDFRRSRAIFVIRDLCRIVRENQIDLVNTHSSLDAWLGGIASRFCRKKVIRTRHLSTEIRGGLNALLLYRGLADFIVTTSSGIIPTISQKAKIPLSRLRCVATGVEPIEVKESEGEAFRSRFGIEKDDILVGTVCVVRSWKGIQDFIAAAKLLKNYPKLKWVIVGGGYLDHFRPLVDDSVDDSIHLTFTGHLDDPFPAIAALDIFALLSTAHEGISQASLQAAYLKKPLIMTTVGGLPEVCLQGKTGIQVPPFAPDRVAEAVRQLAENPDLRNTYGDSARKLVEEKFLLQHTLDNMEKIYGCNH